MKYDANVAKALGIHILDNQGEYCTTCEQDAATCQLCGRRTCGSTCEWVDGLGNVCTSCKRTKKYNG